MVDGIQELVTALQTDAVDPSKTYHAEVSSIDNEGTVWVYLEGSNMETPTTMASSEVEVGDSVNVEWRNNKLYIAGNVSNPSAGTIRVRAVEQAAAIANQAAQNAVADAGVARQAAEQAQSAVAEIEDDITGLNTRLTSAEGDIATIEGNITSLGTRVGTAESNITSIEGRVTAAESDITTVEGNVSGLTTRVGTAEGKVTTLEGKVSTAETNITNLQGRVSTAESDITAVEGDITTLQGRVADAEEDVDATIRELAIAQDVVGTINWITSHGTMTNQAGQTFDSNQVYFVVDANGDYLVGSTRYSVVTEPVASDIANYYLLSISDSVQNYVGMHLAVTSEGLWLLPDAGGNKVLIATGQGSTYTSAGTYIIGKVNNVDTVLASFLASGETIGVTDGTQSYLAMDYHSMKMIDKEGDDYLYISDLRDANNEASITDIFTGNGINASFTVSLPIKTVISVTINGVPTSAYTIYYDMILTFSTAPGNGDEIEVVYITTSQLAKAYTLGIRGSSSIGAMSIAEGWGNISSGNYAHAEGYQSTASGLKAHAEGERTTASGEDAHAEGIFTEAKGQYAHAEGSNTTASGAVSHAEGGGTTASGTASHAQNLGTKASSPNQTALGRYNEEDSAEIYAVIVGNGTNDSNRSNALAVKWNGDTEVSGGVFIKDHTNTAGAIGHFSSNSGTKATTTPASPIDDSKYTALSGAIHFTAGTWLLVGEASFPSNTNGSRSLEWRSGATSASLSSIATSRVVVSPSSSGFATRIQSIATIQSDSDVYIGLYGYMYTGTSGTSINIGWNWQAIRIA